MSASARKPPGNRVGKSLVTQKMVAEAAKVHLSTVSLALRNDARLPLPTRQKIQAVADQLGYTPNPLVSLLLSRVRRRHAGFRGTLGYLHTLPEGSARLSGAVHQNFLRGARARAQELGYNLDEFFMQPDLKPRRLIEMLQARNIGGLVVEHLPSPMCPNRRLPFEVAKLATATVGTPLAHPALHYVANDQYMRPILAAREVLALGYRRIGLALGGLFDVAMAHRCSAGFWAVQEYIPGLARLPIFRLDDNETEPFYRWLDQHRPEVVLGTHQSLLGLIHLHGLKCPDDIGWAHLDWLPEHKGSAGVHGNSEHTGRAAVEMVVSQMHRGEMGIPVHAMNSFVAGTWQPGKTLRRVGPALDLDTAFFSDLLRS